MPLSSGKSKEAFGKNVSTEMHAGKPQKQALAIAYSMKRRGKKMAAGGRVVTDAPTEKFLPMNDITEPESDEAMDLSEEHQIKKNLEPRPDAYASGGMIGATDEEMYDGNPNESMESEDMSEEDKLKENLEPRPDAYAEGGMVADQPNPQIMPKRLYSGNEPDESTDMLNSLEKAKPEMEGDEDSVLGHVMRQRRLASMQLLAKGGIVRHEGQETAMPKSADDFEQHDLVEDMDHDSGESLIEDDKSLVGQVMKKRRMK